MSAGDCERSTIALFATTVEEFAEWRCIGQDLPGPERERFNLLLQTAYLDPSDWVGWPVEGILHFMAHLALGHLYEGPIAEIDEKHAQWVSGVWIEKLTGDEIEKAKMWLANPKEIE